MDLERQVRQKERLQKMQAKTQQTVSDLLNNLVDRVVSFHHRQHNEHHSQQVELTQPGLQPNESRQKQQQQTMTRGAQPHLIQDQKVSNPNNQQPPQSVSRHQHQHHQYPYYQQNQQYPSKVTMYYYTHHFRQQQQCQSFHHPSFWYTAAMAAPAWGLSQYFAPAVAVTQSYWAAATQKNSKRVVFPVAEPCPAQVPWQQPPNNAEAVVTADHHVCLSLDCSTILPGPPCPHVADNIASRAIPRSSKIPHVMADIFQPPCPLANDYELLTKQIVVIKPAEQSSFGMSIKVTVTSTLVDLPKMTAATTEHNQLRREIKKQEWTQPENNVEKDRDVNQKQPEHPVTTADTITRSSVGNSLQSHVDE